jgi:chromosome segregation ATPase
MNGTIGEQISEAFEKIKNSFASTELIKAKADVAERDATISSLNAEITKLKSDLELANKATEKAQADGKAAIEQAKKDADAKVEEKEKEVGTRSNLKAQELVAGAGHTVVKEETTEAGKGTSIDELRKSLAAETNPEKRAAIAAEIREMRGHGSLFKASQPTKN